MQALQDIFRIWPDTAALAADIGAKADTIRKWKKFGRVPQEAWQPMIDAALRRGEKITVAQICAANAPMKKRGRPQKRKVNGGRR